MQSTQVNTKTKWLIDPSHSEIGFKIKHLGFSNVRGNFRQFEADIYTEDNDFTTLEMNVRINPASIDTSNEQRDTHLKSADFFDVEKFNKITFSANEFIATSEKDTYQLSGHLTMKEISKPVTLEVTFGGFITDPWGAEKCLLNLSGIISRKDWGLNYNAILELGGVLLGEEVWINGEIQLIKQP